MIEKIIPKVFSGAMKILGASDAKVAEVNSMLNSFIKEKLQPSLSEITSFMLARPATPYEQKVIPEVILGEKMIKNLNTSIPLLAKRIGEQHFDILSKEELSLATKMIEAFDKIRNLGEGLPIIPLKHNNVELKTFDELSNFIKSNVDLLNEKQKQVIKLYKDLSDEIGLYQSIEPDDLAKMEITLKENIKNTSPKYFEKIEELRNLFNQKTGLDLSFWNMYFPHIQEWKLPQNKETLEMLKFFYPEKAKDMNAFWERRRKGMPAPYIDDPELIYKTMFYNFNWIKKYREILDNTLNSVDLFRKMSPVEVAETINHWKTKLVVPLSDKLFSASEYLPESVYQKFKSLYPEEERFAIWHETRPFSGKVKTGSQDVQNIIDVLFADDIRFKRLKSMGIEKKIYIVPETAYRRFNSWRENIFGAKPFYNPIKNLVSFWKSAITVGTRFVPFRLNNTIGDIFSLSFKDPGAFTELADAFSIVLDTLLGKEIKKDIPVIGKDKFLQLAQQSGIFKSFFGASDTLSGEIIKREEGVFGWLKYIFDLINVSFESTPKVASVLKNLKRIDEGLLPEFTGAEQYILSLLEKSKGTDDYLINAIFERGSTITVDYSNIPTKYRKLMTEFIAPFSYWYARTFDQFSSMLLSTPKVAGAKIAPGYSRWLTFYALPLALSYYWNTSSDERRKIWESLPPYLKFSPLTIVAGVDENTKKPIIFSFYTPTQMVADFLGFDNLFKGLEKVKSGEWDAKDLAVDYFIGSSLDIPSKYVGLLNPAINGIVGIVSNKDMFTKADIVPEDLIGTKFEKQIQFNYFVRQSLLSPIFPAMLSVGFNYPSDFLEQIYNKKDLDLAKDFIVSYFETMFDVKKGIGMVPEDRIDLYMSRAAFEKSRELEAKRNEVFETLYRNYVRGYFYDDAYSKEKFIKTMDKINNNEYSYLSMSDVNNYFNRSSVLRRLVKDIAKTKNKEYYQKINVLLNQIHQMEFIEKTAPKSIRDELSEFLNDLNE